jgi:hypothetical protein
LHNIFTFHVSFHIGSKRMGVGIPVIPYPQ